MNKKQWLLIIAAIISVILIYSLPKIVIDNEKEEISESSESNKSVESAESDVHASELDSSVIAALGQIKNELNDSEDNEKKSIFADSLAERYLKLRQFDSAIFYASMSLSLNEGGEGKKKLADIYYEAMTFSVDPEVADRLGNSARNIYEALLEEQPERIDLMNKVAMTYIVSDSPMKGITMLREVLEKDPDNEDAIFNLGVLSIQSGQYDKGVQRFSRLVQIDSSNIKAYYYLGMCLKETGKTEEAREVLNQALDIESNPEVTASINALLKEL